jgi:hypothetical protein
MWVDDFSAEMAKSSDAPDEFLNAAGYFAAGVALVNKAYIRSPKYTSTNLYLILTSPPGWFRKSSTIGSAMELIRPIVPPGDILPSNPSLEALGRKIPGICQGEVGHGILIYDEFKSFLTHVRKEYASSLASLVTEKLERGMPVTFSKTKDSGTEEFTIPGKFVFSFAASTTTPWLLENIKGSDIGGGMMARFLLVEAHDQTRMYELPPPIDDVAMQTLGAELTRICNNLSGGVEFSFRGDAIRLYSQMYRDMKRDAESHGHPEYSSLVSRGPLYLKKIALLRAVLAERGSATILPEDVDGAGELVWKSIKSCRRIVDEAAAQDGPWGKSVIRVKKIVSASDRIAKGDLMKFVHVRPKELEEILESLVSQGAITIDKEGGDTFVSWVAAQ